MAFLRLHQKQFTFPFLVERTPEPRISPPFPLPVLSSHQLKAFWEAAWEGLQWPPEKSSCHPSIPLPTGLGAHTHGAAPLASQQMAPLLSLTTPALPGRCFQAPFLHAPPVFACQKHNDPQMHIHSHREKKITGSPLTPLSPLSPLDPWRETTGEQQPTYYLFMKKQNIFSLYNVILKATEYSNIFTVRDMPHYWYCNRIDAKDCRKRDPFSPDNYFKYMLSWT